MHKETPFEWEKWLRKRIETYPPLSPTLLLLQLVSHFYKGWITLRHWGYDFGLFKVNRSRLPVVSVGALVCGGTRKTPLTAHIAKVVGKPVGILTGGYAAKIKGDCKKVTSSLEGDEAFLLSQKVPEAKVYAHQERIESARLAEKEMVNYLLMDSGLQHRALHRDIEIVTIDAKAPFATGHFLPRGFLKDLPRRLRAADWVVVMDCESELEFDNLVLQLRKIHPHGKYLGMRGAFAKRELIREKTIGMFCGIANPETFERMLTREGCHIIQKKILSDHEPFEHPQEFVKKCRDAGAELVVCTEKDFVKINEPEGITPLELVLEVAYGENEYQKMLAMISNLNKGDAHETVG